VSAFRSAAREQGGNLLAVQANLCVRQAANTFQCLDDTRFPHCIGNDNFAIKHLYTAGMADLPP
jgi:hypothetical protein